MIIFGLLVVSPTLQTVSFLEVWLIYVSLSAVSTRFEKFRFEKFIYLQALILITPFFKYKPIKYPDLMIAVLWHELVRDL